jgi:hypothetical protein
MRTITKICLMGTGFCILLCANAAIAQPTSATLTMTEPSARTETLIEHPREAASLFITGHSLTDQPMPNYLAEIARSLDTPLQWNRQYVVGSSIATRTRGLDRKATGWQGYRTGYNRRGEGLDVIEELRHPKTIQSSPYDALVITEEHNLLASLAGSDTVRYLRHYHERLIEGNPQATTYFYESWLGMNDKSNPQRWIAYERAASPVWQCIATRINISLGNEGRPDRILSLPVGLAMAELVDRATQPAGLPGITRGSVRETVDSILSDNVHNTELGKYYAALVTYSVVYRRSPQSAWRPKGVSAVQTESLQSLAWDFVSNYSKTNVPLSLKQCREYLQDSFINLYWGYTRDAQWRNEVGSVRANIRWARQVANWHWLVRRDNTENPFYFDSETDRHFWLPAP